MQLILENICHKAFQLTLCLLFTGLASPVNAQHDVADSLANQVITTDSSVVTTDTSTVRKNYFDHTGRIEPESLHLRQVPQTIVDSYRRDDAFWYANKSFHKKKNVDKTGQEMKEPSQWMDMSTLVIIVVIFIGLMLWYLFQNKIISRGRAPVPETPGDETISENIFDINYSREIEKAIASADYRVAIRLMFLRLLKTLSEADIIQYKQERTNMEYLAQLRSGEYYNEFFRLARHYEYTWYGHFDVSARSFNVIATEFEKFNQQVT